MTRTCPFGTGETFASLKVGGSKVHGPEHAKLAKAQRQMEESQLKDLETDHGCFFMTPA